VEVIPRQVVIQPGQTQKFVIEVSGTAAGDVCEHFTCSCVDASKFLPIVSPEVRVQFSDPLIALSAKRINFVWRYSSDPPAAPMITPLTLTNQSGFELSFLMRTAAPFGILHKGEITLQPGEAKTISITFDPHFKGDRVSALFEGRIVLQYQGRAQ
jgi:hypothetical protein